MADSLLEAGMVEAGAPGDGRDRCRAVRQIQDEAGMLEGRLVQGGTGSRNQRQGLVDHQETKLVLAHGKIVWQPEVRC